MAIPAGAQIIYAAQALLLLKSESTPGTDALPTASENAVLTRGCSVTPKIEEIALTRYRSSFSSPGILPGQRSMEFEVEVALVTPVEDTSKISAPLPGWHPLMLASGFSATEVKDNTEATDYFAAVRSEKKDTFVLSDGLTLTVSVDGGAADTVTFNTADFSDITKATATEVAAVINADVTGATATVWRRFVIIATDTTGSGGSIQVTGGTANGIIGFPTDEISAYQITDRIVYTPDSQVCQQTVTMHFCMFPACAEDDDVYWVAKVVGAVANVEFMWDANDECIAKFTGEGAWGDITTGVYSTLMASGVSFLGDDPNDAMVAINCTATWYDGTNYRDFVFSQMSVNLNWSVEKRVDQTASSGIRSFYLNRTESVSGSFNPEEWVTDIYDAWSDVEDSTQLSFEGVYTSRAGSQLTLEIPNIQLGNPTLNKEGNLKRDQPFYLKDVSDEGDDYIVLTFEPQPS